MPLDRKIDPITKDYVDDGAGSTVWIETSQTAVHHQVLTRFGEWAGDPEAGSRLGALPRKLNEITAHEAKDALEDALRALAEAGFVTDNQVEVTRDQNGKLSLAARSTDLAGGEIDLTNLLPWGA